MVNNATNCVDVDSKLKTSVYFTLMSSLLSIFGSSLIIITFCLWKDLRRSMARIIVFLLALADLGTGLSYFVASVGFFVFAKIDNSTTPNYSHERTEKFCQVQSFFTTFFPVASFFWTAYLAIYFFVALVLRKTRWSMKLLVIFNITAWGIPFVICVIAVSLGILGSSTSRSSAGWCFVALNGTGHIHYDYRTYLGLEALCGKGWELLFYVIVVVCYAAIICVNRCKFQKAYHSLTDSRDNHTHFLAETKANGNSGYIRIAKTYSDSSHLILNQAMSKIDWKLLAIPIFFIFLRIWGTSRYFISMSPECTFNESSCDLNTVPKECDRLNYNFILYFQSICDPLQGFGNAILFVFCSKVILYRICRSCYNLFYLCPCIKRREPVQSTSVLNEDSNTPSSQQKNRPLPKSFSRVTYSPAVKRATEKKLEEDPMMSGSLSSSASVQLQYGSIKRTGSISSVNTY